jgi:sulfur carrier protein
MMEIILNGKTVDVAEGLSIADLVAQKKLNPQMVIVEYNYQLANKDSWPDIKLRSGDRLEILHLVGGG